MTTKIAEEIQQQQNHGRAKYGSGPDDLAHDDEHTHLDWYYFIDAHNIRARFHSDNPALRREYLVKVAGLAVSAIESLDRINKA